MLGWIYELIPHIHFNSFKHWRYKILINIPTIFEKKNTFIYVILLTEFWGKNITCKNKAMLL